VAGRCRRQAPRPGHLVLGHGRPGPPVAARDRRTGRQGEKRGRGRVPVKRNRFIKFTGTNKSVNRELEDKARGLARLKGYVTNIDDPTPGFVIDAYHRLFHIEKSFPMSQQDLQARPIHHHTNASRSRPT
jgi:hypothetical protein